MRVNRMAKKAKEEPKKTVVFIVEGNSDKKALEKIFQKIYNHKDIVFKFMGGFVLNDRNEAYEILYKTGEIKSNN